MLFIRMVCFLIKRVYTSIKSLLQISLNFIIFGKYFVMQ